MINWIKNKWSVDNNNNNDNLTCFTHETSVKECQKHDKCNIISHNSSFIKDEQTHHPSSATKLVTPYEDSSDDPDDL